MVKHVFCLKFQFESLGYFPGTWQKYQSKVPYFSACCIWWPLPWSTSRPVEWATFATYADPRLLVPFNSKIDIKGIRHLLGLSRRQQQGEKKDEIMFSYMDSLTCQYSVMLGCILHGKCFYRWLCNPFSCVRTLHELYKGNRNNKLQRIQI